jgi:hypothetical protein
MSSNRDAPPSESVAQPPVKSFVLSRWHGQVPLGTVFWRDMLLAGTALNIVTSPTTILLIALDQGTVIAVAVHFSPLPWNVFLFVSVWRSAEYAGQFDALVARSGAAVWFLAATVF